MQTRIIVLWVGMSIIALMILFIVMIIIAFIYEEYKLEKSQRKLDEYLEDEKC